MNSNTATTAANVTPSSIKHNLVKSFNLVARGFRNFAPITAEEAKCLRPETGWKHFINIAGETLYAELAEMVIFIETLLAIREVKMIPSTRRIVLEGMMYELAGMIGVNRIDLMNGDKGVITVYTENNDHELSDGQYEQLLKAFTPLHEQYGFAPYILASFNFAAKQVSPKMLPLSEDELPKVDWDQVVRVQGDKHRFHLPKLAKLLHELFALRGRQMRVEVMMKALDQFLVEYITQLAPEHVEFFTGRRGEYITVYRVWTDADGMSKVQHRWHRSWDHVVASKFPRPRQAQANSRTVKQNLHKAYGGHIKG